MRKNALGIVPVIVLIAGLAVLGYFFGHGLQHALHPHAAGGAPDAALDKSNAYVDAYDAIPPGPQMLAREAQFQKELERLHGSGSDSSPTPPFRQDLTVDIAKLKTALDLKTPIPEVDPAAKALLEQMQAVNPQLQAVIQAVDTRQYLTDGGVKLRELDKALAPGVKSLAGATQAFQTAMSDYQIKKDEARLPRLQPGSLAYLKLNSVIKGKAAAQAMRAALDDRAALPALDAALNNWADATAALGHAKLDTPEASECKSYKELADSTIGYGRGLSQSLREKSGAASRDDAMVDNMLLHSKVDDFFRTYNEAIGSANLCGDGG